MTKLYQNIKMLCKERKLSIRKLNVELGFPNNTISSWIRKLPSGERLLSVSQYFDVSVDFLLGISDNRNSHKIICSEPINKLIATAEFLELDDTDIAFLIDIMNSTKRHYK